MRSSVLKIIVVLFLFNIIFPLRTQAVTFPNPFCPPASPTCNTTFADIIDKIINFILYVGAAIFPIMASIAGFLFLSSGGDPSKVKKAKDILLYSVIGLFIVLLARGIISQLVL
jgi:hypothetical protein